MSKWKARVDVAAVRSQLAEDHHEVTDSADLLTKRLLDFQGLLGKMRGRVETTIYCAHAEWPAVNGLPTYLGLRLERASKDWVIRYSISTDADEEQDVVWKAIEEAPVKHKLVIVEHLPSLLTGMAKAQAEMTANLHKAIATVDELCLQLEADAKAGDK